MIFGRMHCLNLLFIYIFNARIQEYLSGGGGGGSFQARQPENSLDVVFFLLFFSPHSTLFYSLHRGSNGFITEENYTFPRIQGGGGHFFPGRGGGPNVNL